MVKTIKLLLSLSVLLALPAFAAPTTVRFPDGITPKTKLESVQGKLFSDCNEISESDGSALRCLLKKTPAYRGLKIEVAVDFFKFGDDQFLPVRAVYRARVPTDKLKDVFGSFLRERFGVKATDRRMLDSDNDGTHAGYVLRGQDSWRLGILFAENFDRWDVTVWNWENRNMMRESQGLSD